MLSVDVHQHLWPEQLIAALSARRDPPRLAGSRLELAEGSYDVDPADHDVDARLALLDRDEVDVAILSLAPTLGLDGIPELVEAWHGGAEELVRTGGGRFAALAAGEAREGFAGASIAGRSLLDDPERVVTLGRALEASGGLLFVHPGPAGERPDRPAWWPAVVAYTAEMQAAYAAWLARGAAELPRLPVVFAILAGGAPVQLERLRSRGVDVRSALHPNVFFDTASYGRRALELCLATFGVRQLVYGSDVPVIDSRPTLRAVVHFGEAVSDAVRRENPSLLLA